MKIHVLYLLGILFLVVSCTKDGDEKDKQETDPWSELSDLQPGDVKFDGDYFCYYDCLNDEILCGQRIIRDCDVSQYHEDFINYDCYVVTGWNDEDSEKYYFTRGEEFGDVFFVVCFCGRSGSTYAGTYTIVTNVFKSCEDLYNNSPRDYGSGTWDGDCGDDLCNPCIANCQGRECGPNGCGGLCGTCPTGKKCSSSGQCIDDSSGDPCSACLSTCKGLPGCCTGCGCLCEDECGQCF